MSDEFKLQHPESDAQKIDKRHAHASYMREYYWRHREKMKARSTAFYKAHPEKVKKWNDRWKEKNSQKYKQYFKDRTKKKMESDPQGFRKSGAEKMKAWRHANPDKRREIERRYRINNPEKAKAKARGCSNRYRARKFSCQTDKTADAFYSFVRSRKTIPCYYCGRRIPGLKAHVDHVIAISRSGNHSSENLCASCDQCNHRKNNKLPSQIHFLNQPLLDL